LSPKQPRQNGVNRQCSSPKLRIRREERTSKRLLVLDGAANLPSHMRRKRRLCIGAVSHRTNNSVAHCTLSREAGVRAGFNMSRIFHSLRHFLLHTSPNNCFGVFIFSSILRDLIFSRGLTYNHQATPKLHQLQNEGKTHHKGPKFFTADQEDGRCLFGRLHRVPTPQNADTLGFTPQTGRATKSSTNLRRPGVLFSASRPTHKITTVYKARLWRGVEASSQSSALSRAFRPFIC
jgi:hypothetical protein